MDKIPICVRNKIIYAGLEENMYILRDKIIKTGLGENNLAQEYKNHFHWLKINIFEW